MADNVEANAGTGGAVFATDDIGGIHFPRSKIVIGANNTNDGDVSAANPLPVTGTITAVTAISNALPAGTNNIGDVDVLTIAAGDNNIGNVDIVTVPAPLSTTGGGTEATALRVTVASDSTGVLSVDDNGSALTVDNGGTFAVQETGTAYTIHRSIDLDESEEEVKATAGTVYGMWVTNTATATRFIKFYNLTAANTTVGTSTPVLTIGIPGNATDDISGNFGPGGLGIAFSTAISVAATTGVADADTGAPGANEVIVNIFYK